MDDNTSFIRAIADDPAGDTKRLAYADWLDEHHNPQAADYLRTELALARLPPDAPEAPPLRTRLWQAWATVDPAWLLTFTQPQMLRANPTPFPSAWVNFNLGSLRKARGTYNTWPYDSLPALALDDLREEFQYLKAGRTPAWQGDEGDLTRYRQELERTLSDAAEKGVRLPEVFVNFMSDVSLHRTFRSVTDCFFTLPDEYSPIRADPSDPSGGGTHVHFYCDSQSCILWDLYVYASGSHCVIARHLDYFEPSPSDTEPRAWFVAPSFEAFLYRVWLENQIWYIEHADFLRSNGETPPPTTPPIQAYMDHYRTRSSQG